MSEIDPVILELRADLGKYRADLKSTTSQVQRLLGNQEKSAQRLEMQMRKSSGAIGASLRGLASTIGTYFTGRELAGMIDAFTRLQNNLKVAGLEGEILARVQQNLLDISGRYGTSVEGLSGVFLKASLVQQDLGASTQQIIDLNEIVAASLKVTGTSAQEAQGALLQLGQALGSGVVRAEEFNSILEGALPLAQAAARGIDGFGGSVAKLRKAIADGDITSKQFFDGVLKGGVQTLADAEKATLTLSGAFEALSSRLTVYIGESAKANGVTAALAGALGLLADNLETIIPALSIIGATLAGRFLAGAVVGGRAMQTLAAYASIATTSLAGTALAARGAGAALLGALGGPVGLAITGTVLAIGYLATQTSQTADEIDQLSTEAEKGKATLARLRKEADQAKASTDALGNSADTAGGKMDTAALAARKLSEELYGVHAAALLAAKALADKNVIQAKEQRDTAADRDNRTPFARLLGVKKGASRYDKADLAVHDRNVVNAQKDADLAAAALAAAKDEQDKARAAAKAGPPAVTVEDDKKKKKTPKGRSGPSAEDIARRFQDELDSGKTELEQILADTRNNADEMAAAAQSRIRADQAITKRSIEADEHYSTAQKQQLLVLNDQIANARVEAVNRQERIRDEEQRTEVAEAHTRAESDSLRQQYDLAKSQSKRRELALQIIDLEDKSRLEVLRRIQLDTELYDAKARQLAAIEEAVILESRGRREESARRDTAGPLENYMDRAKLDAAEINEAFENVAVDGLQSLNDGLVDAIFNSENLGKTFSNIAKQIIADLIRIAIQQQIVNALQSAFGGGGGFLGGLFGGGKVPGTAGGMDLRMFGRASGGYVAPGQTVRVNEHAGGVELLRMGSQGGTVIPLGQANARAAQSAPQGGGTVRIMIEEAPGFASTVRAEAAGVAIEVVRATAPTIIQGAVGETQRRMSRPRMPGAGR